MRPPEFTGGNKTIKNKIETLEARFNEAAGIHRRKPCLAACRVLYSYQASMRPPEFTGGNFQKKSQKNRFVNSFNEAAGIHRRKQGGGQGEPNGDHDASMRPPEFTGGNSKPLGIDATRQQLLQ